MAVLFLHNRIKSRKEITRFDIPATPSINFFIEKKKYMRDCIFFVLNKHIFV